MCIHPQDFHHAVHEVVDTLARRRLEYLSSYEPPLSLQLGFLLLTLIWKFDFSPFMVLIIAILNDGKKVCSARYQTTMDQHGILLILNPCTV